MNAVATRIAAGLGFCAVLTGAFGAHGLKSLLTQNGMVEVWKTAVFYHFIHAVMLFILAEREVFPVFAWRAFLAGICLFSGSLYLLAVTDVHWLGAITPVGGVCFLAGWLGLFFKPGKAAD